MTYPHAYYQETVEEPFTGFTPTPQVVDLLKSRFMDLAKSNYDSGYRFSEPEVVKTALVTGQKFAITFLVRVDIDEDESSRQDQVDTSGDQSVDESAGDSKESGRRSRRSSKSS